ncbi:MULTISPECIES: divalent-cation tolerance protein CutA [unclassified Caballeronia]|uniref:divalent-cation tolerance protein CutA n=1 Tax=unclassified Caballeronia TaxID=2646786 RepID=UPI00285E9880|nr:MULTISPECIES: divalent-cation tolerance protein CutA [unclassified Caballeronia]MDR5751851.1 divalent-cation tolerance protein CutA [Caballeronia sp. LZ024]MDR5844009.1 divalent-cation tolerance protein CutA [Caballeronia sp. LZ031]
MKSEVTPPVVLIMTTLPDAASASVLAQKVLEARLAACVTEYGAVRSRYHWQGQVEMAEELQVLFKTSIGRSDELRRFIASNHPYETPEILSWQAEAAFGYGQWVIAETSRRLHV